MRNPVLEIKAFLDDLSQKSGRTAERPTLLEADASARYNFAKKYCKGKKVLDVGTGFGLGAELIARNGATKVLGIDYSLKVINQISKSNKLKNLSFEHRNVLELGGIEDKFDVILAFEVIEHLPVKRVKEFVMLLYDHLVQGGLLFLSTPNGLKTEFLLGRLYNPYHTKEYKKEEIKDLLSEYFPKVDIKGYKLVNEEYLEKNRDIIQSPFHKISYFLGHFKLIREILAFIPKSIKHLVTKENILPTLTEKDYIFLAEVRDCYGLIAIAKKDVEKRVSPQVSIIIPNYNGEKYLGNCLASVLASNYKNFEVIVCDDGSSDKSMDILRDFRNKDKRLLLLRNRKNLGASASRNKALSKAGGEILVFLDNDAVVDKDWLSNLIQPFLQDSTIGAAQALLLDLERKSLVQHAGGILAPQVGWLMPFFQWEKYSVIKNEILKRNIVAVSTALAVKKKVFNLVGGFDEKEAVYTEDIDLSWRIWIAGYKIVLADKAIVYHLSKSVANRAHMNASNFKIYFHLAKNSFRSIIKNYEITNVIRYLPQSIGVNLGRGILVLARRGDISAFSATISAIFWNFMHLSDTIDQRKLVQKARAMSDEYIMEKVFEQRGLIEIYNQYFRQTKLLW